MKDQQPAQRVGEAVMDQLAAYGVKTIFGMPGVHNLELYRGLEAAGIRHVGARHELGAGFMADGYARASGRPGVCLVISGPGVTNAATALGQAYSDSIPVLLLSSAIATSGIGLRLGMLHEVSQQSLVTAPLTVFSATCYAPSQVPLLVNQAFSAFATGRPGPVHLSIPTDVLEMPAAGWCVQTLFGRTAPSAAMLDAAATVLSSARSPIILLGGGAMEAGVDVRRIAEHLRAPVVSTIAGKGVFPDDHPLSLGATLQRRETRAMLSRADALLAVGTEVAEPDLYVTADSECAGSDTNGDVGRALTPGQWVRIDVDPAVVSNSPAGSVGVIGDAMQSLEGLFARVRHTTVTRALDFDVANIRAMIRSKVSPLEARHLLVLESIRRALPTDAIVCADMTQIAYTACVHFPTYQPRTWLFPTGYGTLGYAVPAAIGAKIACPERAVLALVGDGGLLFTVQELATAVEERLALPIVLWNNDGLGEIESFMAARKIPQVGVRPLNPDFLALGAAFGCETARPRSLSELRSAIAHALAIPRPSLIEVREDSEFLCG